MDRKALNIADALRRIDPAAAARYAALADKRGLIEQAALEAGEERARRAQAE